MAFSTLLLIVILLGAVVWAIWSLLPATIDIRFKKVAVALVVLLLVVVLCRFFGVAELLDAAWSGSGSGVHRR